jgi:hypothetical protein
MAWGTPYGYLGASDLQLFDYSDTVDARGDRSYSTFIVLGPRCRYQAGGACDQAGDVALTLAAVEALAAATVSSVTAGSSQGYDDGYTVFALQAADNRVAFTFVPGPGKPVTRPIFRISGYQPVQEPDVRVDGTVALVNTGQPDSGAFVSLDLERKELWVTLNRTLTAATQIEINAP